MKTKILLVLFCISATLCATNYYASPTGSDNGTSYSNPCSLSSGVSKLSSGDTLFLLGGQYNLSTKISISTGKSGTATKKTAIHAYKNEKPILDFRTMVYGERGISISDGVTYIHIKGLTIRYAGKNGLINYGSYCTIENLDVYGCGDTGIQMKTGANNYILNCDSHDNFDYQLGGTSAADFGGNADGFADKQYTNQAGNTYEGCRAWNNSDDGWDFFARVGGTTILKNCICYKNGPAYYNMTSCPRYDTDKSWFDQFPKTVTDADGKSVAVTLENYVNWGNGNGFKLGGQMTTHNVNVYNCLSVGNTVRGFDQNNNFGQMTIYNGSAYDNGVDYGFSNKDGGKLIIKNSLSLQSKGSNVFKCQSVTNVYNSWTISGITCDAGDFSSLDSTLVLVVRTEDGSLPKTMFMQLDEKSDLIDAGINVEMPYAGLAPDLGCYEFGEFDSYPGAVTCLTENASQNVKQETAIADIVFKWSGGATGLSVSALPKGLSQNMDNENKTLTLSGIPTEIGVHKYSVSTEGGSGDVATLSGVISVKSANTKQIAYITVPNSAADEVILAQLNSNLDFSVTIENAANANDYTDYDLLVLSPAPGSTAAGLVSVETTNKPRLLLKPWQLKDKAWNWGTAVNTTDATMTIKEPEHAIFKNIPLEVDSSLTLFNNVTNYGVTYISTWVGTPSVKCLATPVSVATGQSIVEIPIGTEMNGTVVSERFLIIGISEYSTANLTDKGAKLIENACYYLMGMDIPSKILISNIDKIYQIQQNNERIFIKDDNVTSLTVYNLAGQRINRTRGNEISVKSLLKGIYILQINNAQNETAFRKIMIK